MTRAGKSAALILLAVFCAQPLVAATACWLMVGDAAHCDDPCPMGAKPKPSPVNARSNEASCCTATSNDAALRTTASLNLPASRTTTLAPAIPSAVSAPESKPEVLRVTPFRPQPVSSLSTLYCVFLI
ncbi:MAG: hypothetical protein ACRD35_05435 [Candidatus Acidiferrales bacterium]